MLTMHLGSLGVWLEYLLVHITGNLRLSDCHDMSYTLELMILGETY